MTKIQVINNLLLIRDGFKHCKLELSSAEINYFRVARECHLVLYRSAIEALRGTANLTIKRINNKSGIHCSYKFGDQPLYEIQKEKIDGCNKAWRFSSPKEITSKMEYDHPNSQILESDNSNLLDFLDAIAMIQTECFMGINRFIIITDEDMKLIEWLHESIRNQFEHFMPKQYILGVKELLSAACLALTLTKFLLFESYNVIIPEDRNSLFLDLEFSINRSREMLDEVE